MNTVYIDVVFLVNMCIDYILLFLTSAFLHIKTSFIRLILASAVGAVFSVVIAVFQPDEILKILLMVLVLPFLMFACYGKRRPVTCLKLLLTYFFLSVLLGGFVTLFNPYLYGFKNKFLVIALCLFLFVIFFYKSVSILGKEIRIKKIVAEVEFSGKCIEMCLLCDSGNMLVEPLKQLPVILIDGRMGKQFDNNVEYDFSIIKFKSAAGSDFAKVLFPEKISVFLNGKKRIFAAVGFVKCGLFAECEYDGIIPSCLIDNL